MHNLVEAIKQPLEVGAPHGVPTFEDMQVINRVANREFSPDDIFVYPEVMANSCMSSYAFWMGPGSLARFAQDATRGVPKHIMHERPNRAMGMTYAGHYDPETREARAAVFIPKNRIVDGYNSDDEIADIRNGMRKYVSVGPGGAFISFTCDICGKDMFDFSEDGCWHIPGMKYGDKWASACLEGLHLIETSNVDKGAIPGAEIGCAALGSGKPILRPPASALDLGSQGFEDMGVLPTFLAEALSQKAVFTFRASKVGAAEYRAFMDRRGFSDETKTFSTAPASSGKEVRKPMRDKLVAALKAAGLVAIATFMETVEDNPEKLAAALAAQFSASVNEAITNHELLPLFAAAGVANKVEFEAFRAYADLGREYETEIRGNAEKYANAAFGPDAAKLHIETCKTAPLSTVRVLSATFSALADKNVNRPADDADGNEQTPGRQTAPRQTTTYGADADGSAQDDRAARLKAKTRKRLGKKDEED